MIRYIFLLLTVFGLLQSATAQLSLDKEGHRGCRGLMPENTIPAMKKALDLNVTTLEMDVVISKDGLVVVSHDPYISAEISLTPEGNTFSHEEEKTYAIYQMPYEQVRRFDVGSKPNPRFPEQHKMKAYKPLLSELIDSVELYAREHELPLPCYNIEIKSSPEGDGVLHPEPAEFTGKVMAIIEAKKITDRVIIQSFDARPLQLLHQQYPALKLSYLTANIKNIKTNMASLGFTPYAYSPYYKMVKKKTVLFCHNKHIKIVPWTVNTSKEMHKLVRLGVDGIITDYPYLFKELK